MLAAGFSRLLSGMLFGVSSSDPVTVVGVVAIVLFVAAVAALIPAARAALSPPDECAARRVAAGAIETTSLAAG